MCLFTLLFFVLLLPIIYIGNAEDTHGRRCTDPYCDPLQATFRKRSNGSDRGTNGMEESKQSKGNGEEVSTRIGHNECVAKDVCDISNKKEREK